MRAPIFHRSRVRRWTDSPCVRPRRREHSRSRRESLQEAHLRLRSSQARPRQSPPAVPSPRARTRSFRSSRRSRKTDRVRIAEAARAGAHIRPRGGDVREGAGGDRGRGTPRTRPDRCACSIGRCRGQMRPAASRCRCLRRAASSGRPAIRSRPGRSSSRTDPWSSRCSRRAAQSVEPLPVVADDEAAHRSALEQGLEADVLVSSGGVSMGPHDLVQTDCRGARRRGSVLGGGRQAGQASLVRSARRLPSSSGCRETPSPRSSARSSSFARHSTPCKAPPTPAPAFRSGG